jgi:hypothetical protein
MDSIKLNIKGNLRQPLEQALVDLPIAEKRALYRAAYFLRDKIRQQLVSSVPNATQPNPKYSDTLIDAVGFSKVDGASLTITALGNRKKTSGTYRTRFFEGGTKDRYQKSYNGIKLKKKRFLGSIKPTKFFSNAVEANQSTAVQLMQEVLDQYIEEIFNSIDNG